MAGVLSTAERVPPADHTVGAAAPGSVPPAPASEAVGAAAGDPGRVALPATADIRVVGEILAACRRALEAEGDVVIDCGDVERIDAAALQCLGALHRSLAEAGRALTLAAPTASFRHAVEALGFEALVGLEPLDEPGSAG